MRRPGITPLAPLGPLIYWIWCHKIRKGSLGQHDKRYRCEAALLQRIDNGLLHRERIYRFKAEYRSGRFGEVGPPFSDWHMRIADNCKANNGGVIQHEHY